MITITFNLDELTPLDMAVLELVVKASAPISQRRLLCEQIEAAGRANCGADYALCQAEAVIFMGFDFKKVVLE